MSEETRLTPYVDWEGNTTADAAAVLDDFRCPDDDTCWADEASPDIPPQDVALIVAWYRNEDYHGQAIVVYRDARDGKVYENHGSHCSCYGLEGQWQPEEVSTAEILQRPAYVPYHWGDYAVIGEINERIRATLRTALLDSANG